MTSENRPRLQGWEPFSQEFNRNPDAILRTAHETKPVFWDDALECYFVTRHEDVARVFSESRAFSSRAVRSLPLPPHLSGRLPDHLMDKAFINSNDPQHRVARRIANKGFSRPRLEAMEPRIREITDEFIGAFRGRGHADFMTEFAYPLSLRVIVDVLGLPPDDMPRLREWTEDMFSIMSAGNADLDDAPLRPYDEADVAARYERLAQAWAYFGDVIEGRRKEAREDFMSVLSTATGPDGAWALSDDQIKLHMLELVAAGNDTTANLMGNMVLFFSANPEQLEAIMADPSLWPQAIEEGLRRRPTSPHLMRIAVTDVELSDVRIPAGSVVVVNVTGGNNDPDLFPDPERFDIHRPNAADHLAFGKGIHMCLGAPLARAEARIALATAYEQLPGLAIAIDPGHLVYVPMMTVQTLSSLPVTWRL
jgi:cytochrome P450